MPIEFVHLILEGELVPSSTILPLEIWVGLALLSTMTVLLIHLIILMLARAFDIADLKAYAESEMLQAAATFVMAGSIIILLGGASNFAYTQLLSGGQVQCGGSMMDLGHGENSFAKGLEIVRCRLLEKATAMYDLNNEVNKQAKDSGIFDKLNDRESLFGMAVSQGDWDPTLYEQAESYRYANTVSANLMIALNAQAFFITYVEKNMVVFFLPLGIILRGFNFTRAIGAFLISLAIGLYFILPVIFVLTDPGFVRVPPISNVATVPSYCYSTFAGVITLVNLPKVETIAETQTQMTLSSASSALGNLYTSLIVQPFVVLSITLVFIRYGMSLLGGETMELMRLAGRVV